MAQSEHAEEYRRQMLTRDHRKVPVFPGMAVLPLLHSPRKFNQTPNSPTEPIREYRVCLVAKPKRQDLVLG